MKKLLLILIFVVFLSQQVLGITCNYNTRPYIDDGIIKDNIYWNCYNITADKCISYVIFDNDIIQTNPTPKYVDDVGLIDKFDVNNGVSNIYFRGRDLRENKNVTFGVRCGDEVLENVVRPQYKPLYEVIDRSIHLQNNMGYYVGTAFAAIILLILLALAFRSIKWRK